MTASTSPYPRWVLGVTLLSLLAGLESPPAEAQEKTEKPKYGSVRLGPLYLSANAPFAVGVDGNVYNTPEGTSDEAASITPTLKAVLPLGRRARIRSSGGVVPQYFHRESTQRYTDLFGDVRGEIDAGPITAYGGIGGGRYRQRFTLEIDDRLERHERRDVFGAILHVGDRVTLSGSQSRLTSTFDPEARLEGGLVSASLDRRTITRRGELSMPLTRKTSLRPFVDFLEDEFLQAAPGLTPTVPSQRYGAALAFSELAFFNGNVAAGVRHFAPGHGVAPYTGLFLSASLASPFLIGTRLILSTTRDVNYSALASSSSSLRDTYVASTYRADIMFELPLKLHGRLSGGYLENRYLRPPDPDTGLTSRRDHGWLEGAALLRHLGRHLSVGGQVQHESRTSPLDGHSYDGLSYGLAGEVRF